MPKEMQPITDAELSVMQCLWNENDWCTKREITNHLYPTSTDSDLATVQKLLDRLEKKGHVQRDRSETTHRFKAACSKDHFASQQLRVLADQVSDGSLLSLVMHLVDAKHLSRQERAKLREVLTESSLSNSEDSHD